MPPPLLPGILRLAINYACPPAKATNVFHFLLVESGGISPSDVSTVVTAIESAWINDVWKGNAASQWHVVDYQAVYAEIEGAPNVQRVHLADATAGTHGGGEDFANLAYLINWLTGDPRRGGKPRTYMPGVIDSTNADAANFGSGTVSGLATNIATFLSALSSITSGHLAVGGLVEYSTVNKGAYRTAGVYFPIASGTLNSVVGTQRRRVGRVRSG